MPTTKTRGGPVVVPDIKSEGTEITLPTGMSVDKAIEALQRRKKFLEEDTVVVHEVDAFIWDGAWALQRAIAKRFGWANPEVIPGGFFRPDIKPALIAVEVGVGKTVNVSWGRFTIPNIEGYVETGFTQRDGKLVFQMTATVKRKHEAAINALAEDVRQLVKESSIYRGQAIKMRFTDENGNEIGMPTPRFLDVTNATEDRLVFAEDVARAIRTNLYTPVSRYKDLELYGIPFKRGVLLAGTYGTGKTEVAYTAGNKAVQAGITFVYCEHAVDFPKAVQFAQQYAPAVVFCEDIDRVTSGGRTADLDQILNTVDGIEAKSGQVMVVLTTNNVERIHEAMLRPGRLDAVIEVRRPDAKAVQGLIRLYARGLLPEGEDLTAAGRVLDGQIPAVVREVVERSKLARLSTLGDGEELQLTGAALEEAAETMQMQLSLLNRTPEPTPSDLEKMGHAVGKWISDSVGLLARNEGQAYMEKNDGAVHKLPEYPDEAINGLHGAAQRARAAVAAKLD